MGCPSYTQTAGGGKLGMYATPPSGTVARDVTAGFNRADWLLSRTDAVDGTRSATYGYLAGNQTSKTTSAVARTFAWDGRNTLRAHPGRGP